MLPPLMSDERAKQLAARAAVALLPDAGVIGLGSGSTARYFIEAVAELVRAGKHYEGVPTSHESRTLASRLGIPLLDDDGPWDVLVCVDGADEVSDELDLIKGGGGAHTREKIVNFAARKNAIVVDDSKLSRTLGERRAVPVEVLPFAHRETHFLLSLHGEPTLRLAGGGAGVPFRTDSGNYIYDLKTGPIRRPAELDAELRTIPGVVETGLFCGRVDVLFVTRGPEVQRIDKPA
jgi:ribose 5-phosphate isomerase A